MIDVPQNIASFWRRFLDSQSDPADANERFYDAFRIGSEDEDAEEGARLILSGEKTATSALLWEYEDGNEPLPYVGALSVIQDAGWKPVCVVETTSVEVIPFRGIDAEFAHEYGETDGTLEGWREVFWEYYSEECAALGREMSKDTPRVCRRFRVVFP